MVLILIIGLLKGQLTLSMNLLTKSLSHRKIFNKQKNQKLRSHQLKNHQQQHNLKFNKNSRQMTTMTLKMLRMTQPIQICHNMRPLTSTTAHNLNIATNQTVSPCQTQVWKRSKLHSGRSNTPHSFMVATTQFSLQNLLLEVKIKQSFEGTKISIIYERILEWCIHMQWYLPYQASSKRINNSKTKY